MKITSTVPDTEMIEKCGHKPQLVSWLAEAHQDLDNIIQEINDAISRGRHQHHQPDRHFFERMYRLKRERQIDPPDK